MYTFAAGIQQTACEAAVQGSGYGVLEGRSGQEKARKNGDKAAGEWFPSKRLPVSKPEAGRKYR